MSKLPLSAFDDLTLNEIRHIVDVMRDADVDDNDDQPDQTQTIKRSTSKTNDSVNLDPNNNDTLKRNLTYETITKIEQETFKTKNDKKQQPNGSNGIPSVPRVHMGAGFMKIFNQCPLEIHASSCWTFILIRHACRVFH
jgi:hypothetical protein